MKKKQFNKRSLFLVLAVIMLACNAMAMPASASAISDTECLPMEDGITQIGYTQSESKINVALQGLPSDVEGVSAVTTRNVSLQETKTLIKGSSKTYSFNVKGNPNHNTAHVVITLNSGTEYRYINEETTIPHTLANLTLSGSTSRTMTNLAPSHKYEITIINLGTTDLNYTISITSCIT